MDKLTAQFFGDAKRMKLSSTEKALLWQGVSTYVAGNVHRLCPQEKQQAFSAVSAHMKKHPIAQPKPSYGFTFFAFPKLVSAMLVVVLFLSTTGGVAYAAEGTMPGDTLYPVKVHVTEPLVDRALALHPERRARWNHRRLQRRLEEAAHLTSGDTLDTTKREFLEKRIDRRIQKLQSHIERMPEERRAALEQDIEFVLEKHEAFFEQLASDSLKPEDVRSLRKHVQGVRNKWKTERGKRKMEHKRETVPVFNNDRGLREQAIPKVPARRKIEEKSPKTPVQIRPAVDTVPTEGWQSGRMRTTRNRVSAPADRGFESPSLRQNQEFDVPPKRGDTRLKREKKQQIRQKIQQRKSRDLAPVR